MKRLDFIDVGSSKGQGFGFIKKHFGETGFGIDIDKKKVAIAKKAGHDVRLMDIFDVKDKAEWVTIMHTLEHMPSIKYIKDVIYKALDIAPNIYITFPYFDSDSYLYDKGLRFFWSNWVGHTCHLSRLELFNLLTPLNVPFKIKRWGVVETSRDEAIVPLNAPVDVLGYNIGMGKKVQIPLVEVYREVRCIVGDINFFK